MPARPRQSEPKISAVYDSLGNQETGPFDQAMRGLIRVSKKELENQIAAEKRKKKKRDARR
jgi:hypothetical protein